MRDGIRAALLLFCSLSITELFALEEAVYGVNVCSAFPFIWCCQVPNSADLIKPLFPFPHGSAAEISVLVSKDQRTGFWKTIFGSDLENFAKNVWISRCNHGLVLINTPGDHISCYCPLQQLDRSGIIWSASERRSVLKDRHTSGTQQVFILHLNFSHRITVLKS